MMAIDRIPDWEKRIARTDAFWEGGIIDRPVISINIRRMGGTKPGLSGKEYGSLRDRWLDVDRMVELALDNAENTEYYGDALPYVWPNLGPDVFAAFFGSRLEFAESTSWVEPLINDWSEADKAQFSTDNFYWKKIAEMTEALLQAGQGRYYVGLTDLHAGGDALAALRGPQNLAVDMLDNPDKVRELLCRINDAYLGVLDKMWVGVIDSEQAVTNWLGGVVSNRKWYPVSNDFSCMISNRMFEEFFLPGIAEECRHMEASIYHLDGPGALKHLDSLLQIRELSAVQWAYGAGSGSASDWLDVYRKCQAAGKGVWIPIFPDELDIFMENLRPEGVYLVLQGLNSAEEADAALKRIAAWR
jgi:hypothetical protein